MIVQTVSPEQATGQVAHLYAQLEQRFGRVPQGFQLYSASPDLMAQLFEQTGYYLQHPNLGFALQALIRLLVSEENKCTYCISFNEQLLMEQCGYSIEQITAIKQDPALAPLADKERAMLLFVLKGVASAHTIGEADIETLRGHGWSERDIVDGLYHGARNVAVDIMFNAFKVENDI